jgi:L-cysteine:1D-myo-inositol 2-amino-2-deoxy-alpha-D-glucopyranoside ligase
MAVRTMLVENHYRDAWEWDETRMPRAAQRLERWRAAGDGDGGLEAARLALDDDLDSPAAVRAIDAAANAGQGVSQAAALLGVALTD